LKMQPYAGSGNT